MSIRTATPQDVSQITGLIRQEPGMWQDHWPDDVVARAMRSAAGLAFVWTEGDAIAGFICAHDLGFRAYLSELVVTPELRGKGVGRALVKHVEEVLGERGTSILIADVWRDAAGFYRGLGWSEPDALLLGRRIPHSGQIPEVLPVKE